MFTTPWLPRSAATPPAAASAAFFTCDIDSHTDARSRQPKSGHDSNINSGYFFTSPTPTTEAMSKTAENLRSMARHGDAEGINKLITALRRRDAESKKPSASKLTRVVGAKDALSGNTALHFCCANGHSDVALALIEAGAPVNAVNVSGSSALHYAALTGQLDVVKCLVTAGADILLKNNFGNNPFDEATQCSHREVASFLMAENEKQAEQCEKEQKDKPEKEDQATEQPKKASTVNKNTEFKPDPSTNATTTNTNTNGNVNTTTTTATGTGTETASQPQ